MKKKTRGTISVVCGVICILSEVLFIACSLIYKYDFDGRSDMLSNILFLVLGIYFCYIGIKMRKEDN